MKKNETAFNEINEEKRDKEQNKDEKIIQKESDSIVKTIKSLTDEERNLNLSF